MIKEIKFAYHIIIHYNNYNIIIVYCLNIVQLLLSVIKVCTPYEKICFFFFFLNEAKSTEK